MPHGATPTKFLCVCWSSGHNTVRTACTSDREMVAQRRWTACPSHPASKAQSGCVHQVQQQVPYILTPPREHGASDHPTQLLPFLSSHALEGGCAVSHLLESCSARCDLPAVPHSPSCNTALQAHPGIRAPAFPLLRLHPHPLPC